MAASDLRINIGANAGPLLATLGTVRGKLGVFSSSLAGIAGKAGGALAAIAAPLGVALGGAAILGSIKSVLDAGGRLNDLAANTGIAVSELVVLEQAFKDAGVGAEAVGPTIAKLQRSIQEAGSSKSLQETFKSFGLSWEELQRLSPQQQFEAVTGALAKTDNVAKRTAASMAIFGKSSYKLGALITDPDAMKNAKEVTGDLANVMGRNAAVFDRVSDAIGNLKVKWMQLMAGFTENIVIALGPEIEKLSKVDFTSIGASIGQAFARAVVYVQEAAVYVGALFRLFKTNKDEFFNVWADSITPLQSIFGELGVFIINTLKRAANATLDAFRFVAVEIGAAFAIALSRTKDDFDTFFQGLRENVGQSRLDALKSGKDGNVAAKTEKFYNEAKDATALYDAAYAKSLKVEADKGTYSDEAAKARKDADEYARKMEQAQARLRSLTEGSETAKDAEKSLRLIDNARSAMQREQAQAQESAKQAGQQWRDALKGAMGDAPLFDVPTMKQDIDRMSSVIAENLATIKNRIKETGIITPEDEARLQELQARLDEINKQKTGSGPAGASVPTDLEDAADELKKVKPQKEPERIRLPESDSFAKVGLFAAASSLKGFADYQRILVQKAAEQVKLLSSIATNTKNGGLVVANA
jgi:hypothetical protein